jgi:hypothetical protein
MARRPAWLRLLLLASLLAWPRLGREPEAGRSTSSLRADDGQVALAARPPAAVRLLSGAPSGGTAPHRGAMHAASALPPVQLRAALAAGAADPAFSRYAASRGVGSPRFPTGPPVTLPIT